MLDSKIPKNVKSVINFISELEDREKTILVERFVKKKSMREVAKRLGITDTRVNQIEDRLVETLKECFNYINV